VLTHILLRRVGSGRRAPNEQPPSRGARVCIVRQTDLYEIPVKREAEALVSAGYDVEVICMRNAERPRRTTVNGVEIVSLRASLSKSSRIRYAADYVWFFLLVAVTLSARHLRRRYAVVQVNTMPDFLVFAALVPKLLGAHVVLYMKEPTPELAETLFGSGRMVRALARIEQRAIRFAERTLTVTDPLKRRYVERGAPADRITVVLNGSGPENLGVVPVDDSLGHSDEFRIICHGSIEERYGQDTIIEAAKLLEGELPNLRVILVGRGSFADEMCRLIEAAGLSGIVRFEGWVSLARLNELLHSADVGVVAQKASPYSHLVHTNKMVDYWLYGLPVIASRLHAVSELYDDRFLEYYEPGDPAALAQAIRRLHDDPERRAALAENGRLAEIANGWSVQRRIYLDTYDRILRSNGSRVPCLG
jgi:glycosyltransferase involved in cell wall biosynthesis